MTQIFYRDPSNTLPMAVRGEGPYIFDQNDKQYLDGSCGAAVSCLGHNNQFVKDAIKAQIDNIPYAHTGFFSTEAAEELADLLIRRSGLDKVYFLSGGSEANETALKMARQYWVEKGQPEKQYFISRRQSYHGSTIATLSIGGNLFRRKMYQPILTEAHHIAPCYAYREQQANESLEEYGLRSANELQEMIDQLGAEKVIGFIVEPVVGSTLGAVPAVPGYFKRIREICDENNILLILDEIMCGMGRTGTSFAYEQEGIKPDMVTVAKGLGAGYQPVAATIVGGHIFDAIKNGSGAFQHGHTYMCHPTAAAAALATQQYISDHDLLTNVNKRSQSLFGALHDAFDDHPYVGDIRGRGLFLGVELVQDKETKAAFPSDTKLDKVLKAQAMENGLMIYPLNGTIDGQNGHHILLAPSFIFEQNHIDELVDKLSRSINEAVSRFSS